MKARAPGKVFLSGEYAVLEGATAVIAAVARHALADTDGPPSDRPEVIAIARRLAPGRSPPAVDVGALCAGERKLGLGSSAAALVAAAGALLAEQGVDLSEPRPRALALPALVDTHRESQGGAGSGGDVAAALYGGVIAFRAAPLEVKAFGLPEGFGIALVDSGVAARTAPLALAALAGGLPRSVHEAALALEEALLQGSLEALRRAVALHRRGLDEIATRTGSVLVPAGLERVLARAAGAGLAAKPSGAGGGDLAIVFGPCDRCEDLVRALQAEGTWAERVLIDRIGAAPC